MNDFGRDTFKPAPAAYLTRDAFIKTLVAADEIINCNISDIYFESGCQNNCHYVTTHSF